MRGKRFCTVSFSMIFLFCTIRTEAAWEFTRVDSFTDPFLSMEEDAFVYRKNHDVYHFRIGTDEPTAVTRNGPFAVETPLAVQADRVWYVSCFSVDDPVSHLFRFDTGTGENDLLLSSEQEISLYDASQDGGRLVVKIDGDWWVWDGMDLEQVTFSGPELPKRDPFLRGNHLVWAGLRTVYHTQVSTRDTFPLTGEDREITSLQTSHTHAAWVEGPTPHENGYRIRRALLVARSPLTLDSSDTDTPRQLTLGPSYLVYTKKSGERWHIVRVPLYGTTPETLYSSALPLDLPSLHGTTLFFLTMNCVDNGCRELYSHDLETGETRRLTSYGQGSFIFLYGVDNGRAAFVRVLTSSPDEPLELFSGREEPGAVCGTAVRTEPRSVPLNLLLLLVPLAAACLRKP